MPSSKDSTGWSSSITGGSTRSKAAPKAFLGGPLSRRQLESARARRHNRPNQSRDSRSQSPALMGVAPKKSRTGTSKTRS